MRYRKFAMAIIIFGLFSPMISHGQTQGRQIWIRIKGGQTLTGDLVKMDSDSIEFKVKGILQSLKLDEVMLVSFFAPKPIPAQAQAQIDAAHKRNADLQEKIAAEAAKPETKTQQPAQLNTEVDAPVILPDKCEPQHLTIEKGHFSHHGFANTLHDFHYRGEFKSIGDMKINFYITDSDNYAKFVNHKKFYTFFALEKVTEGKFDLACEKGKDYHIVIVNTSVYDARVIEGTYCFSYPGQ